MIMVLVIMLVLDDVSVSGNDDDHGHDSSSSSESGRSIVGEGPEDNIIYSPLLPVHLYLVEVVITGPAPFTPHTRSSNTHASD